jgi:hypothetical protein
MNRHQQLYRLTGIFAVLCVSLVACFCLAEAQGSDTKLVVTITDQSGAVIQGASVVIDQEGCECAPCPPDVKNCKSQCCETRNGPASCCIVAFTRSSDENGSVTFEVGPGIYRAKVEVQNFKSQGVTDIQIGRGQTKTVEVKMEIGEVEAPKSVEVSKNAAQSEAKVLTIELGDQAANASVTVMKGGCSCDECPKGKLCPRGCCECKQGDCVCCIVAVGNANEKGTKSFILAPGEYDISFKVTDELVGSLSGVTIDRKDKVVKPSIPKPDRNK